MQPTRGYNARQRYELQTLIFMPDHFTVCTAVLQSMFTAYDTVRHIQVESCRNAVSLQVGWRFCLAQGFNNALFVVLMDFHVTSVVIIHIAVYDHKTPDPEITIRHRAF
jgi:hypothetical protein